MADSKVTIIGTGLIGTSLGLNLTARKGRAYEVVGLDRDRSRARTARRLGALDRDVGSLEEAVEDASMVILAVPVRAARRLLQDMVPWLAEGAIVTDTMSTKADFMQWAAELLPESVSVIGGHPMAGSDQSGPQAASEDLFQGAAWVLTPAPRATEGAVEVLMGLIESVGARPIYVDPAEHDELVAAVSHMPMLLSVALFRMARDSSCWEDASLLSGPAFRQMTRLAKGDPVMGTDIVATNREAILSWLGRFRDELSTVMRAVELGDETTADLLTRTQADRETFENAPLERQPPKRGAASPSGSDTMGQLLFGGALYDRMKELTSREPGADPRELRRKLGIGDDGERQRDRDR